MTRKLLFILLFVFAICLQSVYSQCANNATDTCTNAAPVGVGNNISCTPPGQNAGTRNFRVTNMLAGATYRISNCGSGFNTQLTIRNLAGVVVGFNDDNGPACAGTAASIDFVPPATGDYRIQLNRFNCASNGNNANGNILVTLTADPVTGVPNDDPCTAIPLAVNATCSFSTYTNENATATTGVPAPTCANYGGGDVWFTITVPAIGSIIIDMDTGVMTDSGMAIYSVTGSCPALTLTQIECDDDDSANGLMSSITRAGLNPGDTIYIRVWEFGNNNNGTFDICVSEGPPPSYCTPVSTSSNNYIDDFSTTGGISNITNNNSGYSAGGYADNTSQIVSQVAGGTINFNSNFIYGVLGMGAGIWVDWDNDLSFNGPGEEIYLSFAYVDNIGLSYTVPAGTPDGTYRMRILADYWATTVDPCTFDPFGPSGEAEDYTLEVITLNCTDNPSNIAISNITTTSADLTWDAATPAPSGYSYYVSTNSNPPNFNAAPIAPGGTTVSPNTSASLTLLPDTVYYVWVRSDCGGGDLGVFIGPETFTTLPEPPMTTGATICQYGSGTISATAACTSTTNTNTINGNLDSSVDNIATQPEIFITDADGCAWDANGDTANYTQVDFQVTISGTYSFASNAPFDAMGYIVIDPTGQFNPGSCVGEGATWTWITGDDDSGLGLEAILTANLTAGVTYTLYTTAFGGNGTLVDAAFSWNVSGPGSVAVSTSGVLQWYTDAVGGAPIGTGTPFNPVGGTSDLTDTDTVGIYTFYAACSTHPNVRTETLFEIIEAPTVSISGSGIACGGPSNVDITLNLTGDQPWEITYTDGTTPVTITGITTSPYVFTVTPTGPTTYTLTAANDANCSAGAIGLTGSAVVTGGKIWDGSVDNNWYVANNWTPSGVPTLNDCVVIPNQATTPNDPVANQLIAPIPIPPTTPAMARNLTLEAGAYLEVETNTELMIREWIDVQNTGVFNLKSSASLIQIEDSAVNTGDIHVQRSPNFDESAVGATEYVYWSTPVANFQVNNVSPTSSQIYNWSPTVGGNGVGNHGQWLSASGVMDDATGYIIRGLGGTLATIPATAYTIPNNTALFSGVPNNGIITKQIFHGNYNSGDYAGIGNTATNEDDNWNLLGNPYPSAISANAFTNFNTNINGTVYVWPHSSTYSAITNDPFYEGFAYNYDGNDYIEHNNTGSNPAGNSDLFISSGQAFFILMNHSATPGTNVTFNNSMRYDLTTINNLIDNYDNSNFFRASTNEDSEDNIVRHRIWLDLLSPNDITNSILVGYISGATNTFDRLYDGYDFGSEDNAFFSILNNEYLSIQGRKLPFEETDLVPLGLIANENGSHTIAINTLDGLFMNDTQDIYIEDTELNIVHNIKNSPYIFTIEEGIHNDRFLLRYTNDTLGLNELELGSGLTIVAPNSNYIKVNSENSLIQNVIVYDLLGRVLFNKNSINQSEFILNNHNLSVGTYIVKATLINGQSKAQKIVLKN